MVGVELWLITFVVVFFLVRIEIDDPKNSRVVLTFMVTFVHDLVHVICAKCS